MRREWIWALVALPLLFTACNRGNNSASFPSPDKSLILFTTTNGDKGAPQYLSVVAEIRDPDGNIVYRETTPIADTKKWSANWSDNQTVHLESADGTRFTISRHADRSWTGNPG